MKDVLIYNEKLTEIHDTVKIGAGTRIGVFTSIRGDAVIGQDCVIGSHCNICPGVVLEDGVSIQTGCHITRGVLIGFNSFIGPGVVTTNDKYMDHYRGTPRLIAPMIGKRCRIGARSVILPGVTIGDDVVVGAGSVVVKDIPDGETWLGVPARKR